MLLEDLCEFHWHNSAQLIMETAEQFDSELCGEVSEKIPRLLKEFF